LAWVPPIAIGVVALVTLALTFVVTGSPRYYALVAFVLSLAALAMSTGAVVAHDAYRSGRKLFGTFVVLATVASWFLIGYVALGAQAEGVQTSEWVRNLVLSVAVATTLLALVYLLDRDPA
jgi:hypothetical protein